MHVISHKPEDNPVHRMWQNAPHLLQIILASPYKPQNLLETTNEIISEH